MRKILVTGATGFIGNHVINRLLQEPCQIVVTSSNPDKASGFSWSNQVEYLPLDLTSIIPTNNYFEFFKRPDLLIHLAWEGLPNYKEYFHIDRNFPRHLGFLKNLIDNGLKDLTVTGTCFEYGMREGCLSEDMAPAPANAYAIAKDKLRMAIEELLATRSFYFKWIRLFYMYGNGQSPNSLLSQLQSALDSHATVFNMSPGDQLRDYLNVEQVADYIVRIALQKKSTGIINCCSGVPVSVKQLVDDYLKSRNADISLNLGYYPYSDVEPKHFWGDNRKLKTILANG